MSQSIRLDQATLAILVMGLFAYLGYRRGVIRELIAMPGIVLAPFIGAWAGVALRVWVNRFYRLAMFARFGGLTTDDTASVMAQVQKVPPLINTAEDVATLGMIVFLLVIAAGYLIGQWRAKAPADRAARLLGAVLGAFNGFLLVEIVLPRFWRAQFAVVVVPTASMIQLLGGRTAIILIVAFLAVVLYGLSLAAKK